MSDDDTLIELNWKDYEAPGLYLIFPDDTRLDLTREHINRITEAYWRDPAKIPDEVKAAVDFQRCKICPMHESADLCDGLRPVLPLLEVVDKFTSFDHVTAIYKGHEKDMCYVAYTSMQRALRVVSCLGLMSYCLVGQQYRKYYMGVVPIMKVEDIADRIYLNIYWMHRGDEATVNRVIADLNRDLTRTTQNQLRRLRLICKNDAFLNAYILTHLVTDVLLERKDRKLKEQKGLFDFLQ